jgi:nitroreductase
MTTTDSITALQWRYAVKTFDVDKKINKEDLMTILESGRLAPSSFGIEPWKFLVVNNSEIRAQLRAAAYDQTKVTDASHLIVITRRTDAAALPTELVQRAATAQGTSVEALAGLQQMVEGSMARMDTVGVESWLKAQTYIPLGIMIQTASLLSIDNCPMEGFDTAKVNEILGLDQQHLSAVSMLALGYRGEDAFATLPKTRRAHTEVVQEIN